MKKPSPPPTACPLCQSPFLHTVLTTAAQVFYRCEDCRHVFLVEMPGPDRRSDNAEP